MAYFDELLQRAITVRNNRAPASNTADLVGGVLVGIVTALQMLLDDKQDELTFDTAPTADSQNPVTSDGIYQALQAIDLSACEKIINKVTSISDESTDVQYPTAKLLYDSLQAVNAILNGKANQATTYTKTEVDALIEAISTLSFLVMQQLPTTDIQTNIIYLIPASTAAANNVYDEYIYVNNSWECIGSTQIDLSLYEQIANKVTTISDESTDTEYPSAKCVYEAIQAGGGGGQPTVKQATIFFSSSMLTKTMPNALSEFTITTLLAANVTSAYYSLSSGATHQLLTFVNGSIEGVEIVVPAGGWLRLEDVVLTNNSESGSIAFKCGEEESADRQLSVFLNEALECKTVPNALGAYTISDIVCYNLSTLYYSLSSGASHQQITLTNGAAIGLNITVPAGGWIRFEDCGRTVYNAEAAIGVKYTI